MAGIILIALILGLAGLVFLSIYMNSKPFVLGQPRLIPWIPLGMFAAAADIMLLAYTISYFSK